MARCLCGSAKNAAGDLANFRTGCYPRRKSTDGSAYRRRSRFAGVAGSDRPCHARRPGIFIGSGDISRVENSGGISASLAGRYATALFDLAVDGKCIAAVEQSLGTLGRALDESPDLKALTTSPVVERGQARAAVAALATALELDPLTGNFLGVLADNRRLGELRAIIAAFGKLAANHRGEITAEVTSAFPLKDGQLDELKKQLRARMGSDVAISTRVDPSILGGLVVRIGSQMIDSSIRTKLNTLAHAMKG